MRLKVCKDVGRPARGPVDRGWYRAATSEEGPDDETTENRLWDDGQRVELAAERAVGRAEGSSVTAPGEPDLTAASGDDPVGVVRTFLAALEDLDVDRVLELVSPDIVYQNVPLPPARGLDEFGKQMRWLQRYCTGFEARLHHIAADGDSVLTERTDVIERGAYRPAFWVCGTFEVADGRITVWRDRFDWTTVTWAMLTALPRALLRR